MKKQYRGEAGDARFIHGIEGWMMLGVGALAAWGAMPAHAEPIYCVSSYGIEFIADSNDADPLYKNGVTQETIEAGGIAFTVTYDDPGDFGFNDMELGGARRARLKEALGYVASVLGETGELDVEVHVSEDDGTGPGAAGGTCFGMAPGWTNGSASERLWMGYKPASKMAEIHIRVDWGYNWATNTDTPGPGQYDLTSILIHEVTHGMGVLSLAGPDGESQVGPGVYTYWDSLLGTSAGDPLLDMDMPPKFQSDPALLTGSQGDIRFGGTAATDALGSTPPVFTASVWNQGSSLSHWGQTGVPKQSVMQPTLSDGITIRQYQAFEIGALQDIGYTNAATPSPRTLSVSTVPEGAGPLSPSAGVHTYAENSAVALIATPAEAWVFDHWEGAVEDPNAPETMIAMEADQTVVAVFTLSKYTLAVEVSGPGTTVPDSGMTNYPGGTKVTMTAIAEEGYRFDHWTGPVTDPDQSQTTVVLHGDTTVTAVFVQDVYVLTLAVSGVGSITPSGAQHVLNAGSEETLEAVPAPGWRFDHWEGLSSAKTNANPVTVSMDNNRNVRAVFVNETVPFGCNATPGVMTTPSNGGAFLLLLSFAGFAAWPFRRRDATAYPEPARS